jgi:hypothetical protein
LPTDAFGATHEFFALLVKCGLIEFGRAVGVTDPEIFEFRRGEPDTFQGIILRGQSFPRGLRGGEGECRM